MIETRCYRSGRCALLMILLVLGVVPAAGAQMPRIGVLAWTSCEHPEFLRGLSELGYEPGKNVSIECRSAGGSYATLPQAAAEIVALGVDVIVSASQPVAMTAHDATDTIPIVSILSGDPVAVGLVDSLARPGGNLTGVSYYATELTAKRLDLLKQALPGLSTVAVLSNPVVAYLPFEEDARRAATLLDITLVIHEVSEPADLVGAFAAMAAEGADAVFVLPDMMLAAEAPQIATLALQHRLPTMAWGDWYTSVGCLMAYSARYGELIYRLAAYTDRILKGANPADVPIEQPVRFELSINLKTADALGLEIPHALLARADEIIE